MDLKPSTIGDLSQDPNTGKDPGDPIGFVDCETFDNRTMNNLIDEARGQNGKGIIFYSRSQAFCNLSVENLSLQNRDFGRFYTMVNAADTGRLLSVINSRGGSRSGTIETKAAQIKNLAPAPYNGLTNPAPGTAVAMIILYSITGVIALLFVVIIVTGAIRAHRHPERYGPRNVQGTRPRQTRAVGIGRAMLESLPLVKFGEPQPTKSTDVELANANSTTGSSATADATQTDRNANGTTTDEPHSSNPNTRASGDDQIRNIRAPDAAAVALSPNATHTEKIEKSLECAICWDDFNKGEEVRMLPCEHKFHPKCIDPWLLDFSGTCPVCRIDFGDKSKDKKDASASGSGATAAGAGDGPAAGSSANPGSNRNSAVAASSTT